MDNVQLLVLVADPARFDNAVEELRRVCTVAQLLPPRLTIIAVPAGRAAGFDVPGVTAYPDEVPEAVLDTLSPSERLFVSAWRSLRTEKERVRPGDHLDWDAADHLPPDAPRPKSD